MSDKKSFIINDESVNSYGFIMRNAGAKLERFNANPIMLDLHSRDNDKVLGRWENLRVEGSLMLADPVWDVDDPYAAGIKGKVDRGFIKGCSLGAVPLKTMYNEDDDMVEVVEWELKEISIASVPSNAGSLVLVDAKGQQLTREALIELSDKVHNNPIKNTMSLKNLKVFAKAINLADTATEEEVLEAVQDLHNTNIELADENSKLTKKVGKLEAENTKLKDAQKDTVKNMAIALVDGAIAGKKILAGERDEYIELAENNYDLTKKLLDKKQAYRSVAEQIENGGAGADVKLSDEIKSMSWDAAFKANKTEFIRLNDPEHFKTIFKAKFGKEYTGA